MGWLQVLAIQDRPEPPHGSPPPETRELLMAGIRLTFELYLDKGQGKPEFEALTCASRNDLMPTVRRIIAERDLEAVEVREMGVPLFTVGR
jgi:hypothetical protein